MTGKQEYQVTVTRSTVTTQTETAFVVVQAPDGHIARYLAECQVEANPPAVWENPVVSTQVNLTCVCKAVAGLTPNGGQLPVPPATVVGATNGMAARGHTKAQLAARIAELETTSGK